MPGEEREDFERRFFESDDFAAELLAAEEELIEDYELGRLDTASAKLFEDLYLAKRSFRDELNLSRSLRSLSGSSTAGKARAVNPQRLALAVIAACLVFVALGLVLTFRENRLLRQEVQSLHAEYRPPLPAAQPSIHATEPSPSTGSIPAILLQAGTREPSSQTPAVKLDVDSIGFLLKADVSVSSKSGYKAAIQDIDGTTLYQAGPLQGARRMDGRVRVELFVPPAKLTPGDYIMLVQDASGNQTLGSFYFRLLREFD